MLYTLAICTIVADKGCAAVHIAKVRTGAKLGLVGV